MYFCYLDESGNAELSGNTGHFVYAGIAIPTETWREKDFQITEIKTRYGLEKAELHSAWIARKYLEQIRIPGFESLSWEDRRQAVESERLQTLTRLTVEGKAKQIKSTTKNFKNTHKYIHLSLEERRQALLDVATCVASWHDSRIFFHSIRKNNYDISKSTVGGVYQDAFQQIVSRFEQFLRNKGNHDGRTLHGVLVSDNNDAQNKKLTKLMRNFHQDGTFWRGINNIIETPFFVDSQLTSMVQVADLISYAVRRFFDNKETTLFDPFYIRVDRAGGALVGGRHYAPGTPYCKCKVCQAERRAYRRPAKKK